MKKKISKVVSGMLAACMIVASVFTSQPTKAADNTDSEKIAGYLATYIAKYEYNMGLEHAQIPSNNYTNNFRTDVLYYGLSSDGVTFTGLNNDRPILYPNNKYKLGSPSVFRKADGTYGLIAGLDNNSNQIFLSDSEDLITYTDDRVIVLNNKNIAVKNPAVVYDQENKEYKVMWEGGDGNSYVSVTSNFTTFSEPEISDYTKEAFTGELPVYADSNEASVIPLTQEEYDRINNKYGVIKSVSVDGLEQNVEAGSKITLPETLDVVYSDNSKTKMGVEWNTDGAAIDFDNAKEGTYTINGTIIGTTEYNSPIADFRADPFILYNEEDGYYYLTGSYMQKDLKNAYDYVIIRRAKTINELTAAEEVKIFSGTTKAVSGVNVTPDYWAPEIHMIGGKYRILVQGTVDGASHQCILTCEDGDLMNPDSWSYTGYIGNATDGQAIGPFDTTYFEYEGQGYYVTQHTTGGSKLDITTVDPEDPTTPTGPRISIAVPTRAFETNIGTGQSILEGPAAIIHDGKVYVTYSGATIDMHYCTNLIYADLDSDLMNADNWTKWQTSLFNTADITVTEKDTVLEDGNGEYTGTMGPGHSNFTVDENGNPLLVYHARDWSESYATGGNKYGLSDPGRHCYVKCIHFGSDGFPILNMTSEQILSENLRNVTMTIKVVDSSKLVTEVPQVTQTPTAIPATSVPIISQEKPSPTAVTSLADNEASKKAIKGKTYKVGKLKYTIIKVSNNGKGTVTVVGPTSKNVKTVKIGNTVVIKGEKYKVTAIATSAFKKCRRLTSVVIGSNVSVIGKNAFKDCKKLKSISVKGKTLKTVGKNAFDGIAKKVKMNAYITKLIK